MYTVTYRSFVWLVTFWCFQFYVLLFLFFFCAWGASPWRCLFNNIYFLSKQKHSFSTLTCFELQFAGTRDGCNFFFVCALISCRVNLYSAEATSSWRTMFQLLLICLSPGELVNEWRLAQPHTSPNGSIFYIPELSGWHQLSSQECKKQGKSLGFFSQQSL